MKLPVAFPLAATTRTLVVLAMGASLVGLPRAAYSQTNTPENTLPATDAAPGDTDVPEQATQTAGAYNQAPARADAIGAARAQARQLAVEVRMRDVMTRNGITSTTTQDAILAFMRDDDDNKRAVGESRKRLWNGTRRDVPIERLRVLMGDYQKALTTAHDNRVRAQTSLDARVGYSLDPRLEAMLWLLGVLGDGQNVLVINTPAPIPVFPEGGTRFAGNEMARPKIRMGMVVPTPSEVQVTGVVTDKNPPQEAAFWLEIRDDNGRLWRMVPSSNPDALPILNRQVGGLALGARVLVRLVSSSTVTPNTPYTLLALSTIAEADQSKEGNGKGANPAPNGQ